MNDLTSELLVIAALLLTHGLFAMAEIAVVYARKSELQERADEGSERAAKALSVVSDPTRFLANLQVAMTFFGVLAGILAGYRVAVLVREWLADISWLADVASILAVLLVVVLLTAAKVFFGELVPKRIAMAHPEALACRLTQLMGRLAGWFYPISWLVNLMADALLRLVGIRPGQVVRVSEDEVNSLVERGLRAGVFNKVEQEMVEGVLELDQLPITEIMTLRPKIVFLNIDDPDEMNWRKIVASGHSRFPVYQGSRDQVLGVVMVKAIWANSAFGLTTPLRNLLVPPLCVPETLTVIQLLEQFRKTGQHMALVVDEFGMVQGLVTMIDVMEAIVGDLPERGRREAPEARKRDDGSWLMDATLTASELKETLELDELAEEDDAEFQTLGGFIMTHFGRIPRSGDSFDYEGWRFEVVDMDRHRVDKVLVTPIKQDVNSSASVSD